MPYAVTPEMQAALDSGATTLAVFIRLERKDGLTLGFTSWPYPVAWTDGVTYRPDDGGLASEIANGTEGIGNLEAEGALTDDRITERDLAARRWDGCEITIFVAAPEDVTLGRTVRMTGTIGETETIMETWRAEVRSLAQLSRVAVGSVTCAECRVKRLGDRRCGVNMSGTTVNGRPLRANRTFLGIATNGYLRFGTDTIGSGHWSAGIVKMLTGQNAGLECGIKRHVTAGNEARLQIHDPGFPFPIAIGDTAVLEAGCDRKFDTCRVKFGNQVNFDGEHLLPGNNQVLRQGRPPS